MFEDWKPVSGFPGYWVSSEGRVLCPRGIMAFGFAKGYRTVGMYRGGKRVHKTVHSLVAQAFIGERPKGFQINHKDGDRLNNSWMNLEYATPLENIRHAIRTVGSHLGARNGSAKLTPDLVVEIRRLYVPFVFGSHLLAKRFGVTKAAIRQVLSGDTWSQVK